MDKIRNFIQKRKLDRKFKEAGKGRTLDQQRAQQSSSSKQPQPVSPVQQQNKVPTRPDANLLAEAAERRIAQSKPAQKLTPMQKMVSEEARKQLEAERRLAQLQVEQEEHGKAEGANKQQQRQPKVLYTCELFGDEEVALPKSEMLDNLEEMLFAMLDDDDSDLVATTIFIIYTLNKEDVRKPAIETINKYLENIAANPGEPKFRRIRMSNRVFQEKIVPCKGAVDFLKAIGFELREEQANGGKEQFLVMEGVDLEVLGRVQKQLGEGKPIQIRVYRDKKVFLIDPARGRLPEPEIPDDFFMRTAEEIRREQQDRTEALEKMNMLRTSKMRDLDAARAQLPKHKYTFIRVRFPNHYVLQGIFNVFEKLQAVREFVSKCLATPHGAFNLRLQANGAVSDENTLCSLGLVPAALVYFQWDDQTMAQFEHDRLPSIPYLSPELEQTAQHF